MQSKARGPKNKYPYQPALGVKTDFQRLLLNFSAEGTVRYEKFAKCWRDLNMSCYCAGRQNDREAREFVEQCLHIATQFWLPPSSFLVRAGAQYLLYGLYYYQLVQPKVKIRVTPDQWKAVTEFQDEARDQRHLDLDYVFQKLMLEKAFQFVATSEEDSLQSRGGDDSKVIPDSMKEETSMLDEIFSSSNLNQLALVHDQYQKMKLALNGEDATEPDTSLNIVNSDLIASVYKTIQTHKDRQIGSKGQNKDKNTDQDDLLATEFSSVKRMLKQKAYELPGYSGGNLNKDDIQLLQNKGPAEIRKDTESWKTSRKKVGLYEKDEIEDIPVEASEIQELFSMPDIDTVVPKITEKTARSADKISNNIDSEEEMSTEDDLEKVDKSDDESGKDISKREKKLEKKKDNNLGIKNAPCVEIEEECTNEPKKNKSGSKKGKTVPASRAGKRKGSKDMTGLEKSQKLSDDSNKFEAKEEVKELTAQEKLQIKLTQRKKEARLKSSKGNKKRKKKS